MFWLIEKDRVYYRISSGKSSQEFRCRSVPVPPTMENQFPIQVQSVPLRMRGKTIL